MEKEVDIVALGELLIDFTEAGSSRDGKKLFEQNPGGAPANLLTVAAHMGYQTEFIGKVGTDMHGNFLKRVLEEEGIGTKYLIQDEKYFTTLAFVEIAENGERQFSFSRKPGADTQLCAEELDRKLLGNCKIFHFGSLSLTDEPARTATTEAVEIAKKAGAIVSYDPNYRESLWTDKKKAVETMKSVIPYAEMMKVSDEELVLLTGVEDYSQAAAQLLDMGPKLIAVTLGSEGVLLATRQRQEKVTGFKVQAVDTTGAGDIFHGAFVYGTCQKMSLENIIKLSNVTAALSTTKYGSSISIPTKKEVKEKLNEYR